MRFLRKPALFLLLLLLSLFLFSPAAPARPAPAGERRLIVLRAKGAITTGLSAYFSRYLEEADPATVEAIVLLIDTPGGLLDATLDLISSFNRSEVPVIAYVYPSGAIAASAGAFLLLGSDLAAMAPGTTVGAAQPVSVSPEGSQPADDKTTSFLAGHLRSIAEERGRPGDIAQKIVSENLTLSAREALEKGVVEYIAADLEELLTLIDGIELDSRGRSFVLKTAGASLLEGEMLFKERFQQWVSNPQISLMLLMLGIMGLYFGLGMPGTFVPEVIGGILLILGIYGLGLFDTNTAGIVLLLAGFGLLVAEIFTAGFGILGIGGAVCILTGAILLPQEPIMPAGWYNTFKATAIAAALAVGGLSFAVVTAVVRSRRSWGRGASFFHAPLEGKVVQELNPEGLIKARGEIWRARSAEGERIPEGASVEVLEQKGLLLLVKLLPGKEDNTNMGDNSGEEN